MRGRSKSVLTRERIERLAIEVNQSSEEAFEVYEYCCTVLMEGPPKGISLPVETVDIFMRTTGCLSKLYDRFADPAPGWMGTVKEFEERIRKRRRSGT